MYNKDNEVPESLDDHIFYGFKLDPEQKEFRDSIWDRNNIITICNARAGTGKAQPLNTIIPTPKGERTFGDIKVGDYVFDRYGNPTEVLGVFFQSQQDTYKITLSDGRSTLCSSDHLWTFRSSLNPKCCISNTVKNMIKKSIFLYDGTPRYMIPNFKRSESDDDFVGIVSIENIEQKQDMQCIYVDNKEHLYLTNDNIVTHNTTIALATANLLVSHGLYSGIVYIVFPTMEQKQGFIPGDPNEKNAPYRQPLDDALISIGLNPDMVINSSDNMQAIKQGRSYIDFISDTYLRGTNFENKVVIIDEAENGYFDQLKKVLTRIHDNCKIVMIGHNEQCDIIKHPERSGFVPYIKAFEEIKDDPRVSICKLTRNYRGWFSEFCDNVTM